MWLWGENSLFGGECILLNACVEKHPYCWNMWFIFMNACYGMHEKSVDFRMHISEHIFLNAYCWKECIFWNACKRECILLNIWCILLNAHERWMHRLEDNVYCLMHIRKYFLFFGEKAYQCVRNRYMWKSCKWTMLSMDVIVMLHIIYDVVIFVYAIVNEQRIM